MSGLLDFLLQRGAAGDAGLVGNDAPTLDGTMHPVPPFDPSRMMSATPNNAGLLTPPMMPVAAPQSPLLPTANYGHQLGKLSMLQQLHMLMTNPKDTLMAAAKGLPGAVGDMLVGGQGAMGQFLTPEDRHAAEMRALQHMGISMLADAGPHLGVAPSLGQSIAHGLLAGEEAGQGTAQSLAQQRMQMLPMQRQMQILQARAAIGQMFAPSPDDTPQEVAAKLQRAYSAYTAVGDTEMMKSLGDIIKEMPAFKGMDPMSIDTGKENILLDKRTGQVLGRFERGMNPDQIASHNDAMSIARTNQQIAAAGQALRADALTATNAQRSATNANDIVNGYSRDTRDWQKVVAGYDVLRAALANPNLVQPYSVLDAYARISNPGAIVRPTTMQMLEEMGTISQRVQKAMQRAIEKNQPVPPEILRDITNTVQGMVRNHREMYRRVRKSALDRAQQEGVQNADRLLPDYDVQLPGDNGPTTAANPLLP